MQLFATPGMATVTVIILAVELLSLIVLWITLFAFRHVQNKQAHLLRTLHDAPLIPNRHRFLVSMYVLSTFFIGFVSAYLYIFQPHIL